MNPQNFTLDITALLDLSPFLTKGSDAGTGVALEIGNQYTWGLLIGGPLLILAGLALVRIMYGRVKFFALEYGNGGFLGRMKVIAPFLVLGTALLLLGTSSLYLGWQALGYSVTLNATGLIERTHDQTIHYAWTDAEEAADRIKSTEFWIAYKKDGRKCRVSFQQRYIGAELQDKAIEIAEIALSSVRVRRTRSLSETQ